MLLNYIERFGVEAVMGRPYLGAGEIKRMIYYDNIRRLYDARGSYEHWAEWAEKNPEFNHELTIAMLEAVKHGKQ